MINSTTAGLMAGLSLGFAGYFGGFGAFVVVAALGLVGLLIGYLARGDVHLLDRLRSRSGDGDRPRGGVAGEPRASAPRVPDHGTAPRVMHAGPAPHRERVR